ncbi:MAG: GNAT family N-acetyltransferase [Marinilabiliales bacterium]|nr:GNAT family N-acetyltransferase [Marinilabiliales bacterium]
MHEIAILDQPGQLNDHADELRSFFRLYQKNFPDADEREEPETIIQRIQKGRKDPVEPETILLYTKTDGKLSGGAILEYYEGSACFLLTYIFVDEELRGKRVASFLVDQGIRSVVEAKGPAVKALFFEANIPWKSDPDKDSFNAWDRYQVFSRLGAKWLKFDYTQPALGNGKKRVNHLHLFLFPSLTQLDDALDAEVLLRFLHQFYQSLGVADPQNDADFIRMEHSLSIDEGKIWLQKVPFLYTFSEVSVALHLSEDPLEGWNEASDYKAAACPVMGSYELDLLKFRYLDHPPFVTTCRQLQETRKCTVLFPALTTYVSEGRNERLNDSHHSLSCELKLNRTQFRNGRKIWTVVLVPIEGEEVTGDQIIQLVSLFNRSSEQSNLFQQTKFRTEEGETLGFVAMVEKMVKQTGLYLLRSGEVEVDFSQGSVKMEPLLLWRELINLIGAGTGHTAQLRGMEERYRKDSDFSTALNLLCGIALGIFDYRRMTFDEVLDTLVPITKGVDGCILMNKGILASFDFGDENYRQCKPTIGINAYLMIPGMLLAYNETEISVISNLLDQVLDDDKAALEQMMKSRMLADRKLNDELLTDVFHYASEKKILAEGMAQRGLDDRIATQRNRVGVLVRLINDKDARGKAVFDKMAVRLLALISILSIEPVFGDAFTYLKHRWPDNPMLQLDGFKWFSFLAFALVAFLLLHYFVLKSIGRGKVKPRRSWKRKS